MEMEAMRKRFMLGATAPHGKPNKRHVTEPRNVLQHSSPKRIAMSNGIVTLYDALGSTDVSTSSSVETKILALESIYDLLLVHGRDLDPPIDESPMVNRIIRTFKSKAECLYEIGRCVSVAERCRILTKWAVDFWGANP